MAGFEDLNALYVNTTLKRQPAQSHTGLLLGASADLMRRQGVTVRHLHLASHQLPPGIYPDMREHGWDSDDWPALWPQVLAADILVIGTPIWLGEESSLCRTLIERLYAMSGERNERGQSIFYNKVGASVITGNEDGLKHVAMSLGFALNHLGFTIPPQADCGWIGEVGPGPSYGDARERGGRVGFDNDFTQRNATIMTWNCLHLARLLKATGGIPPEGNDRNAWEAGERFGFRNPMV
ncbi:MAG: NAD(P)H-dependent oxidoreductase [Pseudomonadota bacterium]|nr:NAD(P)H-dependent oxidoreductase [Pseudomonadota bacterium]HJO34743.1 NAD(P)H-dependent oxidoreductase [Gammaproteobacteria bacterium]